MRALLGFYACRITWVVVNSAMDEAIIGSRYAIWTEVAEPGATGTVSSARVSPIGDSDVVGPTQKIFF